MKLPLRIAAACFGFCAAHCTILAVSDDTFQIPKTLFVFEEPVAMYRLEIVPLCRAVENHLSIVSRTQQDPTVHIRQELLLAQARLEELEKRFPTWRPDLTSYRLGWVRAQLAKYPAPQPDGEKPKQ